MRLRSNTKQKEKRIFNLKHLLYAIGIITATKQADHNKKPYLVVFEILPFYIWYI